MKKKIIAVLVLSLFALPALSGAKDKNDNSPFDQIWNAIESIRTRLDAEDENLANQSQTIENLQGKIDDLDCQLNKGDTCAIDGGGSGGGTGDEVLHCGEGTCARSVQKYIGGVLQQCSPGAPATEVCDGLDNDCDGMSDESFPNLGASCEVDNGLGLQSGTYVCSGSNGVLCQA